MFSALPLLGIVLILANAVAFLDGEGFDRALFAFPLPSGVSMPVTSGAALVLLGLVLLYVEIFKSTRTGTASILDHGLSLLVFVVALVEFLVVARFGHAVFLTLLLMSLIDVVAGFTVSITAARRDFSGLG